MKYLTFLFLTFIFSTILVGQDQRIADKQFMLGCTNVDTTEQITHYISAEGEVWQYSSGTFVTGGVYSNSLTTVGNANFSSYDWPGFNFNWLYETPYWSLGLYKVTNSKQTDKYFYLDARDSDFGGGVYNPDFFVVFNNSQGVYQYKNVNQSLTTIPQGGLVSVWQIKSQSPNTSGLQNFWSNSLLRLSHNSHARIAWGSHPSFTTTNYKIYRAIATQPTNPKFLTFNLIATTSSSTFEFVDIEVEFGEIHTHHFYYYVKAYNSGSNAYSSASNTLHLTGIYGPYKESPKPISNGISEFILNQNYPNPFNPTTEISFSVAENSFISLKVYDVLGNEIEELVSEVKETGNHSVKFNAPNLASGVYFYTLKANGNSFTKKMLLVK